MWIGVVHFPPLISLRMERRMQSIVMIIDVIRAQPEQSEHKYDTKT